MATSKQGLGYTNVPLPHVPGDPLSADPLARPTRDNALYASFASPPPKKDTNRTARHALGLNHGTHVPGRGLVAHVGSCYSGDNPPPGPEDGEDPAAEPEGTCGDNGAEYTATGRRARKQAPKPKPPAKKREPLVVDSGYALSMPLVGGTVVGYSPPLDAGDFWMDNFGPDAAGDGDGDDDGRDGPSRRRYLVTSDPERNEFDPARSDPSAPLFRVLWDGSADRVGGTGGTPTGYAEDLTLPELLSCLRDHRPGGLTEVQAGEHRRSLRSPYGGPRGTHLDAVTGLSAAEGTPGGTAGAAVVVPPSLLIALAPAITSHVSATVSRRRLRLESDAADLVGGMALTASLELRREAAQRVRLDALLERRRRRAAAGLGDGAGGRGRKKGASGAGDGPFGYYRVHPNQYMSGFVPPPELPSDDEDDDPDGGGADGAGRRPRSGTRLTPSELDAYHAAVAERCAFAPSRIAERVRLACSAASDSDATRDGSAAYLRSVEEGRDEERRERERVAGLVARSRGGWTPPSASGGAAPSSTSPTARPWPRS